MRRSSHWLRRVGIAATVAIGLTVAVPTGLPLPANGSKFPLAGLFQIFAAPAGWGADPVTPKQRTGGPVDGSHSVDADTTRANGGVGKARGKGNGELDAYKVIEPSDTREPKRTPAI